MIVTMEHLTKFLKKKIDRKDYGSVLIHLKKGEITGITEKNDYNCAAFVDTVSKPVSTVIVRSYKKKPEPEQDSKKTEVSQNSQKPGQFEQKQDKKDNSGTTDEKEKS